MPPDPQHETAVGPQPAEPRWPRMLGVVVAGLLVAEVLVIAPRWPVAVLIALFAWIAWTGMVLLRAVFGRRDSSGIAGWLFGPAIGFGLGVFGLFLFWAAGLQNWLAVLAGPALTVAAAAAVRRFGAPSLRVPRLDHRDVLSVLLVLLIVPLVTWAPYDHVREPVADGEAYRAYFTADFVWGMTVTAELAKGDVPPANPFLRDSQLHYYWMAHLLSGALYRNVAPLGVTAEQVLLINGLAFGLAFVPFFYGLVRLAGASPVMSAGAVGAAFLANSFEGAERLWTLFSQDRALAGVTMLNIDAVTRWFYQGMPVDGLQRMLLYQPHHLTGYVMALAALWIVGFAEDVTEASVAVWAGILLGLGLLFSTFTAIVVGAAVALLFALRLVQQRAWRTVWSSAILGAAPVAVALGVTLVLRYTDRQAGLLMEFGLNPVATHQWPVVMVLSFGPLLFTGLGGLARRQWSRSAGAAAAALALSATAAYFFVSVPDQQGVWVGWRAGHLLLIAFAVATGALLTDLWRIRWLRVPIGVLVAAAAVLAAPTTAIDVYNAQDIGNRRPGPGFPWTLIVTPAERQALDWIRTSTPPDAIVQFEPETRGSTWWCFITAFAERRMAAGLPGAMIPARPYQLATDTVRQGIFRGPTAEDSYRIARQMDIDYLFTGRIERHFHRPAIIAMQNAPDLFEQVFRNDEVTVFKVRR